MSTLYEWKRHHIDETESYYAEYLRSTNQAEGMGVGTTFRSEVGINSDTGRPYGRGSTITGSTTSPPNVSLVGWYRVLTTVYRKVTSHEAGSFMYRFDTYGTEKKGETAGAYIDTVTSTNRSAYPDNGISGSYWYVYDGIQNQAPVISGSNLDLGSKVEDFVIPYNVTDPDGNAVTVSITLDGASKVSGQSVVLGRNYDFAVAIKDLTLGTHKVVITATDGTATATRTYTFTKTNTAPVIDGVDEDIGGRSTAFSLDYYITDENGDPVTATVLLDEEIIQTITGAQDKQQTVTITAEQLAAFEVGSTHRITIQADDGKGGRAYRYYTFTKTNRPPIISGADEDLGQIETAPTYVYTVTDTEGDEITVQTFLDGKPMGEPQVVADGQEYSLTIDHETWIKLKYEPHVLEIKAWDQESQGAPTVRTLDFERVSEGLEVLVKINEFDIMPKKVIAVPHGMFADDATVTVSVCNNFMDDDPTWEDASTEAKGARAYAFTNAAKTADKWSLGVKIIIENGESGVSSVLRGIKGGYE